MNYSKFAFLLVWTFVWAVAVVEGEHLLVQRMKFKTQLKEFKECLYHRSIHKPGDVLDCLKLLKLETNWQQFVEFGEDYVIDAIEQLQQLASALAEEYWDDSDNWDAIKDLVSDDGSGDGSGVDDDDYYRGHYPRPEGSGYGYGSEGSGYGSEGSGAGAEGVDFTSLIEALKKFESVRQTNSSEDTDIVIVEGPQEATEPNQEPCLSPFVEIAYKMCILPVLDQKVTWDDAQEYCRSRHMTLAVDSVVIKGRKYLDRVLGINGSRERWPIWVGAKQEEDGAKRWLWNDGTTVPNFIWSKGNPKTYDPNSVPAGACMHLDGFREYYGASLPCHYKRRFVCQKLQ